jgi:predicted component of type VI protein secretion system
VRSLSPAQVVGVLVAVEGELEGSVYRVINGDNRLGRSNSCEIEMPSKKISREHAKIVHRDGVFAIMPLSDQNPTILNDEPTEGAELQDGDYVRLGRTTLRFRSVL